MNSFIKARNIRKEYQKGSQTITPLKNISFDIEDGEFIALMGPSGSGKTTLLNLIAGVDVATSGTLKIGSSILSEMNRDQLTKWRSGNLGYVFQLYHLVPVLSAFENVELPLLIHAMSKNERKDRVEQVLELVGLADRKEHKPKELSGGQEQRVAIARAIVTNPLLIVADEPTGDLDRESADDILNLLEQLSTTENKTIVMVTHDPQAAQRAHRKMELNKGEILNSS